MKVVIKDEDELVAITKELLHVLFNLRYYTKLWEWDHGSRTKATKKAWEVKADELLERLEMKKTNHKGDINLSINNDGQETNH